MLCDPPYLGKVTFDFKILNQSSQRLVAKVINNFSTLEKAKILLYEYYVKKLKWSIAPNNNSGIKIKKTSQKNKFVDDFDDFSIWFSVTNENHDVIACARLCKEDAGGLLEIERYSEAKRLLYPILNSKNQLNLIELNREAILPDYPRTKVLSLVLLNSVFNYSLKHNYSVLTTTNIPEWLKLYNSLPFTKLYDCRFRYTEADQNQVEVYFIESKNLSNVLNRINFYLKKN